MNSDGKVVDIYSLATGVRTIKVSESQCLINDKPFYFTGFGKHEDTAVRGKGHDQAYGFSDEESQATFGPDGINNKARETHAQAIRELISRDKNHASVVMWSIANEPASNEDGAREYFEPLAKLARELDSTRPVTFANLGSATYELDRISDLFDVLCLNRYFGWYSETGQIEEAEAALEEELRGWEEKYPDKPIVMTEYGADTIARLHSVLDLPWSEEFQVQLLDMYHRVFDRIGSVVGEHVWNFADFQTAVGTTRVDGNKKGVFTRDRNPKAAAHSLRDRWTNMEK